MISEAVRKSAVLIEALPYIKLFHNAIIVVKLGGSAQTDQGVLTRVLTDVDFMNSVGMRPVVVYGGGKRISQAMEAAGKKAVFAQGQRITDPEAMKIVEHILIDEIGSELKDIIQRIGGKAELLNGRDHGFLKAEKKTLPQCPEVDLQCVGEPTAISMEKITELLANNIVPLIAPVAVSAADGQTHYNINGDTASAFIAAELNAAKLVFLSDTPGIFKDANDPESIYSSLRRDEAEDLIKEGIISRGMIPKVEACIKAIIKGIGKAHIVSGYQAHALLLEIFTTKGVGTEIVH